MKRFALVGKDIKNSFSPAIHSYCFNVLGIDAKYEIIDIDSSTKIVDVITLLKMGELDGINITSPYKQSFLQYIDELNLRAESIGSINCIHNYKNKLVGNNTDWFGFAKSVDNFKGYKNVIIIGTGGASLPLIYYFKSKQNLSIHIVGRDTKKLQGLCSDNVHLHNLPNTCLDLPRCFIINAIPSHANIDWNNIYQKFNPTPLYAFDLNYHLEVTNFLNYYSSKTKIKNGLEMLIYQALMSIDIWFNKELSSAINVEDLKVHINKKYLNG